MAVLHQLLNLRTGEARMLLDESRAVRQYQDVLGEAFYEGTVADKRSESRPGFVKEEFFKDVTDQHGGEWRKAAPGVWVYYRPGAAAAS